MSRPTILTCHFSDARLSKLRFICMKLGLAVKPVPAEELCQPIGALCGLSERIEAAPAEDFAEELLIFCHMDNAAVNRFLTTAKQLRFAPVALKAILTPTNAAWTPVRLCAELKQEREAVLKGGSADHDR